MRKQLSDRRRKEDQRRPAWVERTLLFWILTLSTSLTFARNPKLSQDLENVDPDSTVPIIVKYKNGPSDANSNWVKNHGGKEDRRLHLVHASAYSVPARALADVAANDDVEYIVPDRPVHAAWDSGSSVPSASVPNQTINTPAAWAIGLNGSGIGVAVIDSGIASSQWDLQNKVVYNQSWVGTSSTDYYGHGTFVAGIIAGSGAASNGSGSYLYTFKGVAPGVSLINLRVLDQNGIGKDSDVIAAIQTAIQLQSRYNIRVINLSLGRPVYGSYQTDPLCQAVEAAWQAGITVVTAAGNFGRNNYIGNQGYGTITAPGNDPSVITVGAMKDNGTPYRSDDTIASYSSKGPTLYDHVVKPDMVAPGNRIVAARAWGTTLANLAATQVMYSEYMQWPSNWPALPSMFYMRLSGSSLSAPMVSGAAALLLQQDPNLTPDQVKVRLMESASKTFPGTSAAVDPATGAVYTSQYDIFTIGAGYLDIAAALANNDVVTGPATSPTVNNSASGVVTLSFDPNSAFGNSVLWGTSSATSVIWGSNVVDANSVLWGSSLVWGDSTSQAFSVLWGSNATTASSVLWGSSTTAGSSVLWGSDAGVSSMAVLTQGEN